MKGWTRTELPFAWGKMNVWTTGSGPALIVLHGLGGSGRYWHGLSEFLDHRWTLVAPDLAGFGSSDKPALRYDRAFHLETIDEVARWAGGKPVLAGHSVGAVLAALWAARRPGDIAGLALISALFPRPGLMPGVALRIAQAAPGGRGRVASGLFRTVWPAMSVAARASRRFPAGLITDYGRQSIAARADTMWTTLEDLSVVADLTPLGSLSVRWPNLILDAVDDRYVIPADTVRWQELLPNAERVSIPTGGHQFLIQSGFGPLAAWINAI
ncbi:MAG TPA: alpha/beta hydrolase [Acidimicrobiia bacterium]|nr:alpha/beta hydrolase [Acidimicrobiia bacterium]